MHVACPTTVKLSTTDPDGDRVTCRFAQTELECGEACQKFPYFQLSEVSRIFRRLIDDHNLIDSPYASRRFFSPVFKTVAFRLSIESKIGFFSNQNKKVKPFWWNCKNNNLKTLKHFNFTHFYL